MNRYTDRYTDPTRNAQDNLMGRTHYVDPGSLRFHKSRVLSFRVHADGLLCSIIESCVTKPNGSKRGFRYVIFDIFGHTIARPDLDNCASSRAVAERRMWDALGGIDAVAVTREAIDQAERYSTAEYARMRADLP